MRLHREIQAFPYCFLRLRQMSIRKKVSIKTCFRCLVSPLFNRNLALMEIRFTFLDLRHGNRATLPALEMPTAGEVADTSI